MNEMGIVEKFHNNKMLEGSLILTFVLSDNLSLSNIVQVPQISFIQRDQNDGSGRNTCGLDVTDRRFL